MQATLSIIQTVLSDWYLLILANPLFAAALTIVAWLLTAMLYSVRIASLKKKITAGEHVRIEIQNNLDAAQQQLRDIQEEMQQIQRELAANREQMEKAMRVAENEAQRASGFEQHISQRNKQIAEIIETMATHFYFSERPLLVAEDIKAEGLWQQHEKVIVQLAERLRSVQQKNLELQQSYQAETTKRLEQEALITTLQTTLTAQTSQLSKLEQALEEQKSILQQQRDKAQQALSNTLEKHQADLVHLTKLEQQALELVATKQQLEQLTEQLSAKDALITQLEHEKSVEQVKVKPELARQDENVAAPIELIQAEEIQSALPTIQQAPDNLVNVQFDVIAGKFKNLFGNPKQQPIIEKPEDADIKREEVQPEPVVEEELQPATPVKEPFGEFRNLFVRKKQQTEEAAQEEVEPEPVVEQQAVNPVKEQFGKIRGVFGSKKQQAEEVAQEEIEPEPVVEQQPVNPVKEQFGKIRGLFGSKNQQAEETVTEEVQPVYYDKGQVDESTEKAAGISNQMKGFYRKFTAKSE